MAVTNTFVQNTKIESAKVNTNFDDHSDKIIYFSILSEAAGINTIAYNEINPRGKFLYTLVSKNVVSIKFHALIRAASGQTATVKLYNNDAASDITGSEISTTSTSYTWVSSGDIKGDFPTTITDLVIYGKSTSTGINQNIGKGILEIVYK